MYTKSVTVGVGRDLKHRRVEVEARVSCVIRHSIDPLHMEEEKEKVCESMLRQLLQQVSTDFVKAFKDATDKRS